MAYTCSDVITAAYQDAQILMDDETPVAEQAVRGLRLLQNLYRSLVTSGTFGRFKARLITGDYTAGEGERIGYSGLTTANITLPTTLATNTDPAPYGEESVSSSSSTTNVDTNNRAPRDLSLGEIAGNPTQTWIYDAALGDWVSLEGVNGAGLALSDAAPLCGRFFGEITALLAYQLANKPAPPDLARAAGMARTRLAMNQSAPDIVVEHQFF